MWVDKDLEPTVSFTFKGAEAGWMTAKRHTNECVPRVIILLSTHTMWPFIALSSASMAHATALGESVSTVWWVRTRLWVWDSSLAMWPWVLELFWSQLPHLYGSLHHRVIVKIQWSGKCENIYKNMVQMSGIFSMVSPCLVITHWLLSVQQWDIALALLLFMWTIIAPLLQVGPADFPFFLPTVTLLVYSNILSSQCPCGMLLFSWPWMVPLINHNYLSVRLQHLFQHHI
jgi:hypothetical protein